MEIIRLVEESDLAITGTLDELDVPKSTFFLLFFRCNFSLSNFARASVRSHIIKDYLGCH